MPPPEIDRATLKPPGGPGEQTLFHNHTRDSFVQDSKPFQSSFFIINTEPLSPEYFVDLCDQLRNEWSDVGKHLGVTEPKLNEIKRRHSIDSNKKMEMFAVWYQKVAKGKVSISWCN